MALPRNLAAYSQVAHASYGKGLIPLADNSAVYVGVDVKMSSSQAQQFDRTWAVIEQSTPSPTTDAGFSAVLLRRKDAQGNAFGEGVLAIAGTDPTSAFDLMTDYVSIYRLGTAVNMTQYKALEAFYAHLKATGKIGATERIVVTGHSLGGFLTQAFTVRHPEAVSAAYTYNAPGFSHIDALARFVGGVGTAGEALITNVVAIDGLDFASKLGSHKLGTVVGARIEPAAVPAGNHSIARLADALQVQALYTALQPDLSLADAGYLLAASGLGERRLEAGLDALRSALLGAAVSSTAAGDRDALYAHARALGESDMLTALAGKVRLTPVSSSLADRALARTDFQTLAALETQSPFILDPIGAEGQAALDALWQSAGWNTTYQAWLADKSTLLNGEPAANFSDAYLADRAGMLEALVERNARDLDPLLQATAPYQGRNVLFLDLERDERVAAGAVPSLAATVDVIAFGKLGDDLDGELWGGDGNDRLHGLAGHDVLRGANGDDLLDGSAGNDQLHGGRGNDVLIGGPGDDRLVAGAGADILRGGAGNDRYVLDARDGAGSLDRVDDADGVGVVEVVDAIGSSYVLNGGRAVADGLWLDADGRFSYRLAAGDGGSQALLVAGAGIQLRIENWSADRPLGITLQASDPREAPETTRTILGDLVVGSATDELGNYIPTGGIAPDRFDRLFDSADNDHIDSGGGLDIIHLGRGGDDWVEAGTGRDAVYGGPGADWIESGAGRDYAYGGGGDDLLWGTEPVDIDAVLAQTVAGVDAEADLQHGGPGDDLVVGGASADGLMGEDGADTVVGGAGDDHLFGDRLLPSTEAFFWDWRRVIVTDAQGNVVSRTLDGFGLEGTTTPDYGSDQGADVLLGGPGADWIFGDGGDDSIDAGDGADLVYGGAGADFIEGGAGDDELTGDGDDVGFRMLSGVLAAEHGNDLIDGGAGNDRLFGSGGRDYLAGGDGDDLIQGDDIGLALQHHGDDVIDGGAGRDLLYGNGGDDVIDGGAGMDQLAGEAGRDRLDGGDDDDTLFGDSPWVDPALHGDDWLSGGAGDDALVGGGGRDQLIGGAGHDVLYGDDVDLVASAHGEDVLDGGDGDDYLAGMGGDDWLDGGAGADTLLGGDGHDVLVGGDGLDYLDGGAGDDTYVVAAGESGSAGLGLAEWIGDLQGANVLVLNGFSAESVSLHPNGATGDLLAMQGDAIVVIQGLTGGHVAEVRFADGSSYSAEEFFGRTWIYGVDVSSDTAEAHLLGGRQADQLAASGGGSSLWGGLGDDQLSAGGGANTFHYRLGDGVDTVRDTSPLFDASGQRQRSTLAFGAGIAAADITLAHADGVLELRLSDGGAVRLPGFDAADPLAAASVDRFTFADGSELSRAELLSRGFDLQGTSADESLAGTALADRLNGGAGTDLLRGGAGADLYRFEVGDGFDVVADGDPAAGTGDVLRLGPAFFIDAVGAGRVGDDLVLRVGDDAVTLRAYFAGGPDAVERIEFDDGTEWTPQEIRDRLLRGTVGDDLIVGDEQPNEISGGPGTDRLEGRGGDDRYLFGVGDGADLVVDTGGDDRVHLGPGLVPATVQLRAAAGDLVLDFGDGDRLTLAGYLRGPTDPGFIEGIAFDDGTLWDHAEVMARLPVASEGDDVIEGSADDDVLDGLGGNDNLYGGAGNDRLIGGRGDDRSYGGDGDDVFEFAAGDGADLVSDLDPVSLASGGSETLQFGAGIAAAGTTLARQGADLALMPGAGDRVVIEGYFGRGDFETIRFADGTVWSQATVASRLPINGTAGADTLTGTATIDVIDGLGNPVGTEDIIDAGGGNDLVDGGAGRDVIRGGDGNDRLYGGIESTRKITYRDVLYGEAGNDVLNSGSAPADMDGGEGNDILIGAGFLDGGNGNNLLVGSNGVDTIRTHFTGHSIVIGGPGADEIEEWGVTPWDGNVSSRNVYLYNSGDGKESWFSQDPNSDLINDVVSLGRTSYSQLKIYEPRDKTYFTLNIGKVEIPGTFRTNADVAWHDTKYLQIIVSASDYAPASTDPLRNRKVVVIDWDAFGRDFWATRSAGGSWNLLDKLRQHIAWTSDTHAIGGAIAYQYGTVGHIDAVTDVQRFAILADPSLGLNGQPIDGAMSASMASSASLMAAEAGTVESSALRTTDTLAPDARWQRLRQEETELWMGLPPKLAGPAAGLALRMEDGTLGLGLDQQARSLLMSMAGFAPDRSGVMDAGPMHAERFASLAPLTAAGGLDWR